MAASLEAKEPAAADRKPHGHRLTTEWRYHACPHAWHMGERFLVGYPWAGKWHHPPLDVVSVYVDQKPANELSQKRSEEFGFKIYPKIADALRCGGD